MDGDKITILANLNVRASQPALDFMCLRKYHECKKLVGTLPRGLNVRVIGKPISVGNQYWAKVQFDQGALY